MVTAIGGVAFDAAGNAEANGNTLTVKGTVNYGAQGGYSEAGSATGNFVFIDGGTAKSLWGGRAYGGVATGNTVTLISGTVMGNVSGGWCSTLGCDAVSGNTLAVQGKDFPVGGRVENFDTLNFTLPADIKHADTMLSVGMYATFGKSPSYDATVSIAVAGMPALAVGDHITLIDANAKLGSYTLEISPTRTPDTAKYFWVAKTGDDLYAELTAPLVPIKVAGSTTEGGEVKCEHPEVAQDIGTTICTATANTAAGYTFKEGSMTASNGTLTERDGTACKNSECRLSGVTGDVTVSATFTKAPTPPTPTPDPDPTPDPAPTPSYGDSSSPTMGELGLLLSGMALAGAAAPALRRRERKARKQD
ncbi:MAG: hypothetical protein IJM64_05310 [Ottowia sp.]|nr:hypothetical protein [Ottowia sp.]